MLPLLLLALGLHAPAALESPSGKVAAPQGVKRRVGVSKVDEHPAARETQVVEGASYSRRLLSDTEATADAPKASVKPAAAGMRSTSSAMVCNPRCIQVQP